MEQSLQVNRVYIILLQKNSGNSRMTSYCPESPESCEARQKHTDVVSSVSRFSWRVDLPLFLRFRIIYTLQRKITPPQVGGSSSFQLLTPPTLDGMVSSRCDEARSLPTSGSPRRLWSLLPNAPSGSRCRCRGGAPAGCDADFRGAEHLRSWSGDEHRWPGLGEKEGR